MVTRAEDEVARLLAAWRRERPDVDVSPLAVWSRLSRLAVFAERARAEAFRGVDLDAWGFDVLAALRRAGAPYQLSPGALTSALLVTSGTMTHRIDRLEALGLVSREPDPTDGRGVLVTLSAEGRQRVDRAVELLSRAEEALLEPLGPRERQQLATALQRLLVARESS